MLGWPPRELQLLGWHSEYAEGASARAKNRKPGQHEQSAGGQCAAFVLTVSGRGTPE